MDLVLWKNIQEFDLDHPVSEYGFSTRLENENFWTENFAQGAIHEYKKFMYLAAVSETMVSSGSSGGSGCSSCGGSCGGCGAD